MFSLKAKMSFETEKLEAVFETWSFGLPKLSQTSCETRREHYPSQSPKRTLSTSLTVTNNKRLPYKTPGNNAGPSVVLVHGLGGSTEFYTPLTLWLRFDKSTNHILYIYAISKDMVCHQQKAHHRILCSRS
jgi:hypothetical protein